MEAIITMIFDVWFDDGNSIEIEHRVNAQRFMNSLHPAIENGEGHQLIYVSLDERLNTSIDSAIRDILPDDKIFSDVEFIFMSSESELYTLAQNSLFRTARVHGDESLKYYIVEVNPHEYRATLRHRFYIPPSAFMLSYNPYLPDKIDKVYALVTTFNKHIGTILMQFNSRGFVDKTAEPEVWVNRILAHPQQMSWKKLHQAIKAGRCALPLSILSDDDHDCSNHDYETGDGFRINFYSNNVE